MSTYQSEALHRPTAVPACPPVPSKMAVADPSSLAPIVERPAVRRWWTWLQAANLLRSADGEVGSAGFYEDDHRRFAARQATYLAGGTVGHWRR